MNISEWESICEFVVNEIAKHVQKFTTPISLSHEHGRGEGWGTGNYFKFCDHPFLLTNQHILQHENGLTLAHLPGPTDDYVALNSTRKTWPHWHRKADFDAVWPQSRTTGYISSRSELLPKR